MRVDGPLFHEIVDGVQEDVFAAMAGFEIFNFLEDVGREDVAADAADAGGCGLWPGFFDEFFHLVDAWLHFGGGVDHAIAFGPFGIDGDGGEDGVAVFLERLHHLL